VSPLPFLFPASTMVWNQSSSRILTVLLLFRRTKHGITTETAAYERPPPSRSVNAVPGHTNPAGKPELLMLDGSLRPPDGMLGLMRLLAPATFGIALDENQNIDTVRLRGAATVDHHHYI